MKGASAMSLVRWKPEQDLMAFPSDILSMQRSINKMFDSLFHGGVWDEEMAASMWNPAVDVQDRDQEYVLRVELPGVARDDVNITTRENIITIRGEKKQEKETRESTYRRTERLYGSFQRSFSLPGSVKNDKIEATFKDGILEIVVPKAEEAKTRAIEVKVK
jgi:HSP20 family protein